LPPPKSGFLFPSRMVSFDSEIRDYARQSFQIGRSLIEGVLELTRRINGLRGIGLPAAYVSGYLRTARASGATRLQRADAMHAWVMVWCGGEIGWIGFDPTNNLVASDEHIVLAVGRDYTDVAPIDGVIVTSGGQRIDASVNVVPVN